MCSNPKDEVCTKLIDFLASNFKWMLNKISENPTDSYWQQVTSLQNRSTLKFIRFRLVRLWKVNMSLNQLQGLYKGYTKNFEANDNGVSQMPDMIAQNLNPFMKLLYDTWHLLKRRRLTDFHLVRRFLQLNGDLGELMAALTKTVDLFYAGSCSALIKVSLVILF